jgi:hypothetical protein
MPVVSPRSPACRKDDLSNDILVSKLEGHDSARDLPMTAPAEVSLPSKIPNLPLRQLREGPRSARDIAA